MEITKEQLKLMSKEAFAEGYKAGIEIMSDQIVALGKQNISGYVIDKIKKDI